MKHLVIFLTLLTGCTTHMQQNPNPRSPIELTSKIKSLVNIENESPLFSLTETDEGYYKGRVAVGSELLRFDYYKSPGEGKKHLVFIYKILNDVGGVVSGLFKNMAIARGYDCVVIQQENFLSVKQIRPVLPDNSGYDSYDEYNAKLARGVGRIIKYWIPTRPQLSGKYAFVGVSMGGIHAVGAASLFPDASLTVAIMAGGGNVELFKGSQESIVIHNRNKLFKLYASRLKTKYPWQEINYKEVVYRDIEGLNFDILRIAKSVDTTKIKLMITLYDTSVPTQCQWNLYHALGGPEAMTFPTGHYTLALYYFSVREQLSKWLAEAFD